MAKGRLSEAQHSRLAPQEPAETATREAPPALVKLRPEGRRNMTMRMSAAERARLDRLTEKVGEALGRPVASSDVMRGLLLFGERIDARKLVDAVKDAYFDPG